MKKNISIFIKYWLPLLIWAGGIFYFSSIPNFSYKPGSLPEEIILRKGAHFLEYFVFAWLLWRILRKDDKNSIRKSFWVVFIAALFYAASDELHQFFIEGRTGRIVDVAYDSLSALIALEMLSFWLERKKRKIMALAFFISALLVLEFSMIQEGVKELEDWKNSQKDSVAQTNNNDSNSVKETQKNSGIKNSSTGSTSLPQSFKVDVPFTSQAPFGNWDQYHEEACEEASLVMVKYFLDGKKLTPEIADKEIMGLIDFEIKNYGDYKDTNAEETAKLGKDYYGITNFKAVYDFQPEDLKKYLAMGKPIIVPAAGRKLGNPNFSGLGPLYHALVLVGYDKNKIITNDPGTKKGKNYTYDIKTLYEAIHDFPGKPEEIESGRKAMIILE